MEHPTLALAFLVCSSLTGAIANQAQTVVAPPTPAEFAREAAVLLERNYPAAGPGAAVLVARGDTVLFRAARGEADIDEHVQLRPDSMFRIASVTKQFTAAGVLELVESSEVELEDPLSKYLPDFPGGENITVLELLDHTSGVKDYTHLPGYVDGPLHQDMTTAQMIQLFAHAPPDFAPGTAWAYSNSNYVLLGAVIEAVTDRPWYAYLEETLFQPLRMRHTGYGQDPGIAERQVEGYSFDGRRFVPGLPMSMTQPHAAGALVSNVDDLFAWSRALHEGRVLGESAYSRMITPVGHAADPGVGYGFGLYRGHVRRSELLYHGGAIFGFSAWLGYVPGPDITVVVLENDDSDNSLDDAKTLARRLAALALGDPYPAMRAVPVEPAALHAAEGVYRFGEGVARVLRVIGGRLTVQRDHGPRSVLTPIAADDFLYEDGFDRLQLERDSGGRIIGMRFFAGGDGEGEVGTRTDEPLPGEPVALDLPRSALERLAGEYSNGVWTLKVYLEGGALEARLADQPPVSLRATSPLSFEVEQTGAVLEFAAGEGPSAEVTIRQDGRQMKLTREP